MSDLAILVPVKGRPHRVVPLLESIEGATPGARVVFLNEPGDPEEADAIDRAGAQRVCVDGNYAQKINLGVKLTGEPLIFLGADDLHFHPGWLEAARARLGGKTQVVGTNDLCNAMVMAGRLATHPLVDRRYVERGTIDDPTKVLHEGYTHEYVDREFTETAIRRSAFDYAPDAIVEHLHPDAGKAPMDDLYAARPRRMREGRKVYRQRRRLWTS